MNMYKLDDLNHEIMLISWKKNKKILKLNS